MTDVLATFGSDLWEEITMWICLSKAEGSQCAAWSCSRSEHPPPRQEGDLAVSLRPQPWKWHGVTFALCCLSAESLDSRGNGQGHRLPLLIWEEYARIWRLHFKTTTWAWMSFPQRSLAGHLLLSTLVHSSNHCLSWYHFDLPHSTITLAFSVNAFAKLHNFNLTSCLV